MVKSSKEYDPSSYFTEEQHRYLYQRQIMLGHERAMELLADWEQLKKEFEGALGQGIDPTNTLLHPLVRQTLFIKQELLGNDPGILQRFEEIKGKAAEDLLLVDPGEGKLMKYVINAMDAFQAID